jgi:hypothetical protein
MRDFIDDCLNPDPNDRPTIEDILEDERYPFLDYTRVFEREKMNLLLS